MGRACVTVNASVLAAAIRVDTRRETDIRTVVVSDDRGGLVPEYLRLRRDIFSGVEIGIALQMNLHEPIGRIHRRPASADHTLVLHQSSLQQRWDNAQAKTV